MRFTLSELLFSLLCKKDIKWGDTIKKALTHEELLEVQIN
jgi:hypothetical protein